MRLRAWWQGPWPIVLAALAAFQVNGDVSSSGDDLGNVLVPLNVLRHGRLSFDPLDVPLMFTWRYRGTPVDVVGRDLPVIDPRARRMSDRTAADLQRTGELQISEAHYALARSALPGLYVNTFGIGTGLVALPFFALVHALSGGLPEHPGLVAVTAKLVASLFVALSAGLVFLAARRFVRPGRARVLALAYALGTCVWATSSQMLWQHAPDVLFLSLGAYLLLRSDDGWRWTALAGAAFAAAALCRPVSGLVLAIVGLWLAWRRDRALVAFVAGALPLLLALVAYNAHYLGSPLAFGQIDSSRLLVADKTGGGDRLWGTPLWLGAVGLLASPSRGLLVFSPFFLFLAASAAPLVRDARYAALRPLALCVLGMWLIAFKWYDWWGGRCFGYRPIVDTTPFLALLLVPAVERIAERRWMRVAFAACAAWAVAVQLGGAFAYTQFGWNVRQGRDVDRPEHRGRLWSVGDGQLAFIATHLGEQRRARLADGQRLVDLYQRLLAPLAR